MQKHTILVIDDEALIFDSIQYTLEGDYTLYHAENGQVGLSMLEKHKPDLILLDIRMPVMDGFEFLRKIKLSDDNPFAVIVLSGHAAGNDISECYDLGITAFLRKPFNIYELKGLVKQCIHAKTLYKQLYQKEKSIRFMVEQSLDIILSIDKHYHIKEFNPTAQEKFLYSKEDVVGKHWGMLFFDADQAKIAEAFSSATGKFTQEVLLLRKDGKTFPSYFSVAPMREVDGTLSGMVCNARDLTAEKELTEIKRKKRDLDVVKMTLFTVNDAIRNELNGLQLLRFHAEKIPEINESTLNVFDAGMENISEFLDKLSTIKKFTEKDIMKDHKALDVEASQERVKD